jgi:hypothetical protein
MMMHSRNVYVIQIGDGVNAQPQVPTLAPPSPAYQKDSEQYV